MAQSVIYVGTIPGNSVPNTTQLEQYLKDGKTVKAIASQSVAGGNSTNAVYGGFLVILE